MPARSLISIRILTLISIRKKTSKARKNSGKMLKNMGLEADEKLINAKRQQRQGMRKKYSKSLMNFSTSKLKMKRQLEMTPLALTSSHKSK